MATIDAIYLHLEAANETALQGELKDKEIGFVRGATDGNIQLNDNATFLKIALREKPNRFTSIDVDDHIQFETGDKARISFETNRLQLLAKGIDNIRLNTIGSAAKHEFFIGGVDIGTVQNDGIHVTGTNKLFLNSSGKGTLEHDDTDLIIKNALAGDVIFDAVTSILLKIASTTVATTDTNGILIAGTKKLFLNTLSLGSLEHDGSDVILNNAFAGGDIKLKTVTGADIILDSSTVEATSKVTLSGLPTSVSGLPSGGLWNNSGVVNIV